MIPSENSHLIYRFSKQSGIQGEFFNNNLLQWDEMSNIGVICMITNAYKSCLTNLYFFILYLFLY